MNASVLLGSLSNHELITRSTPRKFNLMTTCARCAWNYVLPATSSAAERNSGARARLKFRHSVREYGVTANRCGITLWEIYTRTKSRIYAQEREIGGKRD